MTALERLGRTRRALVLATIARAVLLALASGAAILAAVALADLAVAVPREVRVAARASSLVAALLALASGLRTLRIARSPRRVALWIEERMPALRYALVTLAEAPDAAHRPVLERQVQGVAWERDTGRRLVRRLVGPAIAAMAGGALLLALPDATLARVAAPRDGDALARPSLPGRPLRSVVAVVVAEVHPPAYTGAERRTIEEPSLIAAPVGSRLELRGRGSADRVQVDVDGVVRRVARRGSGWAVTLPVGPQPFAVRLRDSTARDERVLAVEPRPDGIPRVTLESPARDTVLRVAAGRIALVAEALDDYGIAAMRFEWIVSAGEGENFTFRSGAVPFAGTGARSRRVTASLALDSLGLTPGSMVHVRAVARDGNTVTGPGEGVSETRLLRIARAGEYDSLAIEAAAPPQGDSSALSQRMLIQMTEALEKRRPRLDRGTLLRESSAIARDQIRLRKRVGEIIFQRLTGEDSGEHSHDDLSPEELMAHAQAEGMGVSDHGDETPILAINQPLLEAYNAMWEAQTALLLGELREALPPMYRALDAIQRARAAERLYLRGRPNEVVIDLAKVRLAGERPAAAGARTARPVPAAELALRRRIERALDVAARSPAAGADSLLLVRLAVIGDGAGARPALASALAEAATRLRGRDAAAAEEALRGVRRALDGEPRRAAGLPRWGELW